MTSTSNEEEIGRRAITGHTPRLVGLMVFLGGIAMIVMVFVWAYALYSSVGEELNQVAVSRAAATVNPATAQSDQSETAPTKEVVIAAPSTETSLAQVGAKFALKLVFLALMAWTGALVASKGVAMTKQSP